MSSAPRLGRNPLCSLARGQTPGDGGLGLPLKTVQVRMGHGTLAMTADTYGHLWPAADNASELAAAEAAFLGQAAV